ncbi:PseG/SpsG family protein [Luteipulveratus mongoliensis]|uniref:Spore coat protein n=1 Tax=Luteipulveratus mongoliensis TaxID=571913 RepID=A0A0K1JHZ5_9MICO|nr:hypothetical protein [Luteipulveratus mongoliensis]AKU16198.1 hypothetical protein VV02_10545 [Luteipulveratus mongoliensis]
MDEPPQTRVVLRCDAHPTFGVGHLIRSLALAEELQARGVAVSLVGDLGGITWVEQLVRDRGIPVLPAQEDPAQVAEQVTALAAVAVVLDGYHLPSETGAALRTAGLVVLAMVDAEFGAGQEADLYVDQNLRATPRADLPPGAAALAGLDYALFRDTVLTRRRVEPVPAHDPPRLLAVFGGTDPYAAAATVVPLVLATEVPVQVTVIAAREEVRTTLAGLSPGAGQSLEVLDPVSDLAALAAESDVAVSASGSSVWELLCLGVPTGVVCVVDNQRQGYTATVGEGVVAPVGVLDELRTDDAARAAAVAELRSVLTDGDRRADLAALGQRLVDGQGRTRVADALLARLPR